MCKKSKLLEQMRPQMSDIVSAWNNDSIIIESQFDFADHHNLKLRCVEIYQILIEFGGEEIETLGDIENIHAYVSGDTFNEEGFKFCIFNPDKLNIDEMSAAMARYFKNKYR